MVSEVKVLLEDSGFPHLQASVVLIRTQEHNWLVDCGLRGDAEALVKALARCKLRPKDIDGILLTHVHYDHCDNVALFPAATVYVHEREWLELEGLASLGTEEQMLEYLRTHYAIIHPVYQRFVVRWVQSGACQALLETKRVELLGGTKTIEEDVTMIESPGHSKGHMSVRIWSSLGIWVAGDSVSSEAEYRAGERASAGLCWDLGARAKSIAAIGSHAGWVVPGHGPPFLVNRVRPHQAVRYALGSLTNAEDNVQS